MRKDNAFIEFMKRAKQTLRLDTISRSVSRMFSRSSTVIDPPIVVPKSGGVRDESKAMRRYRLKRKAKNKRAAASRRLNWKKAAMVLFFLLLASPSWAQDQTQAPTRPVPYTVYWIEDEGNFCMSATKTDTNQAFPVPTVLHRAVICPYPDINNALYGLVIEENYKGTDIHKIRQWRGLVSVIYRFHARIKGKVGLDVKWQKNLQYWNRCLNRGICP